MTNIDLETEDKLEYNFYPVTSGSLTFKIRAPHDAHVALTSGPAESDPMYEIFIGGWNNTKSVIRKNRTKPDVAEAETPDVLNGEEFRGFWIRWSGGTIEAGHEGDSSPFLSYTDPEPAAIGYFGLCTGWGASGTWKVDAQPSAPSAPAPSGGGSGAVCWVPAKSGEVPPTAVQGGQDNGEPLYVARAPHEGALIPGKLVASHGVAYVAWGGAEHGKEEYEVLCDCACSWVPASGGQVPEGAVPGGQTEDGEPLFVGRVEHNGSLTVGKVQSSHSVLYIPYGGEELGFSDYEVLVVQ
ncbi:uncharacterized protein LOC123296873 isoform X3 [Chrysoperla carnea]|uniref:uncharacterized protein LOC123296873 isoform X3 n=1 Tax=Chrysoperla carnea TaxID=189513 RepID=UPI001D08D6F1|nr:uncharacterized protein LOC123296873 isoform X3 [Chrysoperla carnea]